MQLSAMMLLLAAVGTFSVQAGVISERANSVESWGGSCRQYDCTILIERGVRDPATFRDEIITDAKKSMANLVNKNALLIVADGTAVSSLFNPDAAHPGTYWATVRIHRGQNGWPSPGAAALDLPGVKGVRRASLTNCVARKVVTCSKSREY